MNTDIVLSPRVIIRAIALCAIALTVLPGIAATKGKHHAAPAKHHHITKHPAIVKKVARVDPAIAPVVGTWYVNDNGKESRAQRLALRSDGTFAFIGTGWNSGGTYTIKDRNLALEWTQVDGNAIKAGSMHKNIPLSEDMAAFTIDKYNYAKHVEAAAQN